MYEKSVNEAELILSTQKDAVAPVRKIWEEVVRRSKVEGFTVTSLSDFSAMLEGDRRFLIIPAQIKDPEDPEVPIDSELEDSEMERLGFFSEDQVKLRTAKIIEQPIAEEEEEIGSIRRKAFVSHTVKKDSADGIKKKSSVTRKISKPFSKKKQSPQKSKAAKKTKPVKSRKMKSRTRSKK
jgi:hypothetical protein